MAAPPLRTVRAARACAVDDRTERARRAAHPDRVERYDRRGERPGFDHLVLRCRDVETTLAWYRDRLGMEPVRLDEWRAGDVPFPSVRVDEGTIIDLVGADGEPHDGRLDHLCLAVDRADLDRIPEADPPFEILDGPVQRFGARGMATSIYLRDPDGLVVELRSY